MTGSKTYDNLKVTKQSGIKEPFSIQKLRGSLKKSKASDEAIESIIAEILPQTFEGISTKKIYSLAFKLLRAKDRSNAARFHLKKGMMELGPSGFPFERFVSILFKNEGFKVENGVVLEGKCVSHEIDVKGVKDDTLVLVECKYRNNTGMNVDVKVPLYIQSRFKDLLSGGVLKPPFVKFKGYIITNSRFTIDAIKYSKCEGLKLMSWDYPDKQSLRDIIDRTGTYPLTCLTTLTQAEKQWLLNKNYVLVKEVCHNEELLFKAGVRKSRLKKVMLEGERLCS